MPLLISFTTKLESTPGGEKAAHLHVGDLVHGHALGELLLDLLLPVFQALVVLDLVADTVVALYLQLAVLVGEAVGARQLVHVFEDGPLVGDIFVGEVLGDAILVQLFYKAGVGEEALDLAAEEELPVLVVVVEGLDAEDVPAPKSCFFSLSQMTKANMPRSFCSTCLPYSS